jgi:hypothetical protein
LSPAFSATDTTYTATVAYEVSSITISATANHAGATVSGAGSQTLVVGANSFSVRVAAQNGTTKTYRITVTRLPQGATGVEDALLAEVSLYPNPFAGELRLAGAEGCTLTIATTGGALVHSQKVRSTTVAIRLEHLPAGIYFIRLEKNGKVKTLKAVKE